MASCDNSNYSNTERLLLTRKQVAKLLGNVDVSTIRRLERAGRLKAVRLTKSPSGKVFFRREDVLRLVQETADAI
jgi:predicted site-specific integrase-resolvase